MGRTGHVGKRRRRAEETEQHEIVKRQTQIHIDDAGSQRHAVWERHLEFRNAADNAFATGGTLKAGLKAVNGAGRTGQKARPASLAPPA